MRRGLGLTLVALFIAAACGGTPQQASGPSASGGATAAPPPVHLEVSYSNVIGDELPLWATEEGGFFDKNGLDVNLQNIASAQGVPAVLAGQVTFAQVGGSEVLSSNAGGADLVVIAQLAGVYPFVLEVAPDIKSIADLKGKKIGVSSPGSSSDIATRVALKKMGLDPEKDNIAILPVGSAANRVAALFAGSIQAGLSQPPDSLDLEAKGFHVLYDLASQKLPSANTSVAVRRSYIAQNKPVVQRYVDSIVQGIKKLKSDKAFGISVLKKYFNSTDEAKMSATYDFYALSVAPSQPFAKPEMYVDSQVTLGATNAAVKGYDISKMLDSSFVQSAVDRGLDK